ncbi:MAG TPA: ribbon-helix-helix domain-containing protein [Thermoplasmata archaeon]|nr:ribbon-helix-helix domain-containing protein [Thermoplasmata archaeon]
MTEENEKVTIRVPKKFLRMIDFLVKVDDVSSRSQAIRDAIRDYVYHRTDVVAEKVKRFQDAEKLMSELHEIESKYGQQ